jgi:hypothetical protein
MTKPAPSYGGLVPPLGSAMLFIEEIRIKATPRKIFDFLAKKHEFKQEENSPVLFLEKTTEGELGVGTRYEEHVRMIPGVVGKIYSEIRVYEPGHVLEEAFQGAGMVGTTKYEFTEEDGLTVLRHEQNLSFKGLFAFLNLILKPTFGRAMRKRILSIKSHMEARDIAH